MQREVGILARAHPAHASPWELLAAGAISFTLAAAATAVDGWPGPVAHDEFSLLLGGETIAQGRLANPAHVLPQFFETFHVLQTPAYTSKYFPGHSLFLALGIAVGNSARLGQWIAFAFMGAAVTWSLRGWVSRNTAWSATGCTVLLLADTPWASGFWGASVSCAGSALVLGAYPRVIRSAPSVGGGCALGAGAALLALTRPWEGLWVCAPVAIALASRIIAARGGVLRAWSTRVVLPAVVGLAVGALLLARHSAAVSGSWRRLAYSVYEQQAGGAPPFVWQAPHPVRNDLRVTLRERDRADLEAYTRLRAHPARTLAARAKTTLGFYGGPLILSVFGVAAVSLRQRAAVVPLLSLVAGLASIGLSSFFTPNYFGPLVPFLVVLAALGAAALWAAGSWRRRMTQTLLSAVLIAGLVNMLGTSTAEARAQDPGFWTNRRRAIARRLDATPGQHLVFVRYTAAYIARFEWVQNSADRSSTRTLWAHDLGDTENRRLLAVEGYRRAWLLELESPNGADVPLRVPYSPVAPATPVISR